jgi:hypothetical protein
MTKEALPGHVLVNFSVIWWVTSLSNNSAQLLKDTCMQPMDSDINVHNFTTRSSEVLIVYGTLLHLGLLRSATRC